MVFRIMLWLILKYIIILVLSDDSKSCFISLMIYMLHTHVHMHARMYAYAHVSIYIQYIIYYITLQVFGDIVSHVNEAEQKCIFGCVLHMFEADFANFDDS